MSQFELLDHTVASIVRDNYRAADVFKKYGINYCCSGNISLKDSCSQKQIDPEFLLTELQEAVKEIHIPNSVNFASWKTDFLVDYIINVHHAYLYQALPVLENQLVPFATSHRKKHPELLELVEIFKELSAALSVHNRYEEEILFPYIKQIESTYRRKESYGNLFVKTLRKPLGNVEAEHKKISAILKEIRQLTSNYKEPENACTNHKVIFQKLLELDNDMMQHKHLENNILFPRAIQIEKELLQL
jgi:regulator of cell morphogenesis and NO signaling